MSSVMYCILKIFQQPYVLGDNGFSLICCSGCLTDKCEKQAVWFTINHGYWSDPEIEFTRRID